ncbi:pleckstrin homology domain-containing family S member 1-like [Labeo rohita]|uniref:pleckstrin homology domain-containing family S member 1-like n=1 Tax=Labeo rohita TaxID=84645 RepID=UPI0021E25515|nr:pleckstrin homology domain-containing family S member 1-like [Labeo rohita]
MSRTKATTSGCPAKRNQLLKSPPSALSRNTKAWRNRFFMLSKTGEDSFQLTYHANHKKRDKPLGAIDISKISLLFTGPEAHQKWDWIQKNFKCSPSSVLFMKVEEDAPKNSREYFLIGENSDDVNGWLSALVKLMKIQQSQNTLQNSRQFRLSFEPLRPNFSKDNDRCSAPELMLTYPSRYRNDEYPHKLSEPSVPVMLKIPVFENKDEKDRKQNESPQNRTLQGFFLLYSEMHTHVEKEICVCQNDLKNSLILTQEEGKPCVSDCRKIEDSCLFHKGDQILAFNDLLIDTVEEIQTYLRRLSKDEVKLTVRRLIGSQPLHSEPCPS